MDYYSLNRPESFDLFGVKTEEAAIEKMQQIGVPCFYRVGKRGAYFIKDGEVAFEPSVELGPQMDPTGCGNSSTAACFAAMCKGWLLYTSKEKLDDKKPYATAAFPAVLSRAAFLFARGHRAPEEMDGHPVCHGSAFPCKGGDVYKRQAQIKLPAQALLIAVYEDDMLIIPHGETVIRAGQSILAFADEDSMEELNRIFGSDTAD